MPEYKAEAVQSVTRERPSRPPEVRSDVAVPLAQAVVTATLVAIGVLMLLWPDWRAAALAWWVVALVVWLWKVEATQKTLWQVESVTMRDLDGDGKIGAPEQTVIRLEGDDGWRNVHVERPPDKLALFAQMLLDGKPMSETAYTGSGKPFSKSEWNMMRDALIGAHLAEWINPRAHSQGFRRIEGETVTDNLKRVVAGGNVAQPHARTHARTKRGVNLTIENKTGKGTP